MKVAVSSCSSSTSASNLRLALLYLYLGYITAAALDYYVYFWPDRIPVSSGTSSRAQLPFADASIMENKFTPSIDSRASYYQVPLQNESASLAGSHTYPASAGFAAGKGASRSLARPWYRSPWVLYGAPAVLLAIIAAAVVGGIEGSKSSKNSGSSSGKGINNDAAGSNAIISTDSK